MSDIGNLITAYKMDVIPPITRAIILVRLGRAINNSIGANITEHIVFELITLLGIKELESPTVDKFFEHYKQFKEYDL